ncbi:hypothetical protein HWV62_6067 [Athelia sp. TMB]|nr:hypothetical protein HWV62_6067 [Athelia sp. TMB]
MSSTLRTVAKHARVLSKRAGPSTLSSTRHIHSAFAAQSSRTRTSSPLTTPPKETPRTYEYESSTSGSQTYVVSEPPPADKRYGVPSGAYPTSAPYENFAATEKPEGAPISSTSSHSAHPATTRAVPHNESGVGESSAVRNAEAPGGMGKRGGGRGGLRMMDPVGTKKISDAELGARNPPPNVGAETEKFAKAGVDEAWKLRK